jgi:ribosomal protein RSM22 (predicted rRNA methylase)
LIENWWINRTSRELCCDSLLDREPQIQRSIQQLSDRFTTERQTTATDYFADEQSLCSYGLFFFPQTFARTGLIVQEITARGWKPEAPLSILDLGAGAGAASLCAASMLGTNTPTILTAVDRSTTALTAMQEIVSDCSSLWPDLQCSVETADIRHWMRKETRKWDLIIASFSLNEMAFSIEAETENLVRLLNDKGLVIVIEPALRTSSEKLELWRDRIAQRNDLHIWAPCLHSQSCPLLREGKYWCHEVRPWHAPESLAFFNRHLYRQAHVLKFSFLVFGKTAPAPVDPSSFRLISPVTRHKKALLFTGCTSQGTKKDFRLLNTLIGDERKHIKNWKRGDIVSSLNQEGLS